MEYEKPAVTDFGGIANHTFTGATTPGKDSIMCTKDKFGEESCPDGTP